jgi:tetratricopeptide (TPR) repeat protein
MEAEKHTDQALNIQKQLVADFPTRPRLRQDLARSFGMLGLLRSAMGQPKDAEKAYEQALSLHKQLADESPNQPDPRNELAYACVNLARLHLQQGNWAEARRLLLDGRPHHLAALKASPRHPTYRHYYREHLRVLTQVHAGLLEQADAVRTAETCRDVGWNAPADAYDAACFLSQCIPIVTIHAKLDAKQRQEAV